MGIIRVKKTENFATISKAPLEDATLSWKAKGIWTYLMTKPNDWEVRVADIVKHSTDGEKAVYSGLAELQERGYIDHDMVRGHAGHWQEGVYTVYETPRPGFRDADNRALTKNEGTKNEKRKNLYVRKRQTKGDLIALADREMLEKLKRRPPEGRTEPVSRWIDRHAERAAETNPLKPPALAGSLPWMNGEP